MLSDAKFEHISIAPRMLAHRAMCAQSCTFNSLGYSSLHMNRDISVIFCFVFQVRFIFLELARAGCALSEAAAVLDASVPPVEPLRVVLFDPEGAFTCTHIHTYTHTHTHTQTERERQRER